MVYDLELSHWQSYHIFFYIIENLILGYSNIGSELVVWHFYSNPENLIILKSKDNKLHIPIEFQDTDQTDLFNLLAQEQFRKLLFCMLKSLPTISHTMVSVPIGQLS